MMGKDKNKDKEPQDGETTHKRENCTVYYISIRLESLSYFNADLKSYEVSTTIPLGQQ